MTRQTRKRRDACDEEQLIADLGARLRRSEATIDPMTQIRLSAARRRALAEVPPGPGLGGLVLGGRGALARRRAWFAVPGLAVAALALALGTPRQAAPRAVAAPSAETLEWLAQEEGAPMAVDLYEDLDLVIWLEHMDGRV